MRLDQCFKSQSPLFAYKARPLDGIWATAPYLHNGSVPTLYDLLTPPDQRPASFNVGNARI
jgi:cytochrome c peroxidase